MRISPRNSSPARIGVFGKDFVPVQRHPRTGIFISGERTAPLPKLIALQKVFLLELTDLIHNQRKNDKDLLRSENIRRRKWSVKKNRSRCQANLEMSGFQV